MIRLLCAVMLACMLFILPAQAETAKLPIDFKGGTPPKAECFLSDTLYEDETIRAEIEEYQVDKTRVVVARVKIADPSQLRSVAAYGFNRPQTEMPVKIARRVGAVVAINGDYYSYGRKGYLLRQGQLFLDKPYGDRDVLLIDENGDFYIEKKATEETLAPYKDRAIVNAFNFGPGLVIDGEVLTGYGHEFNSGDTHAQRSCIAQIRRGELEYLLVSCEGPMEMSGGGMTMDQFAAFVHGLGVENAYNLDGGNSAALIFGGEKQNAVHNKDDRMISDIIYFASAAAQE